MIFLKHFGVYGICIRNKHLLCIKKNGGPYHGRYDLPGGTLKEGESLLVALKREIKEETGYNIAKIRNNQLCDVFVELNKSETLHHVFGLYDIELSINASHDSIDPILENKEKNDSNGIEWVSLDDISIANSSPLILSTIQMKNSFKASVFNNWHLKE